jgi:hypothetical protein
MLPFFADIIAPLFERLLPRTIVEVGSESGKTTARLLGWAKDHGAVVHAVDPAPRFDVAAWQREHGERFVFHRLPSLVALSAIDAPDAVLLDGDHNWYTVHAELGVLEARSKELGAPMPLVLLHDVGWPYGRRDLYYDPKSIPPEYRHPFAQKGIDPTRKRLVDEGGLNAHLYNALEEGGPRNGVLTAVEDYLKESARPFVMARIPAVWGLAILLPLERADACPEARAFVDVWRVPEIERFVERLEMARVAMLTGARG